MFCQSIYALDIHEKASNTALTERLFHNLMHWAKRLTETYKAFAPPAAAVTAVVNLR
jgi:hypothetical protein